MIVLVALALVVTSAGVASTMEHYGEIHGAAKVTVGGSTVAVRCTGTTAAGKPTVVLLAGMPDPLGKFKALQDTLSKKLRVCAYDRLGEGGTAKPRSTQTLQSSAALLHGLLAKIAPGGDVVLVGHSLGGLIAAEYAHAYPRQAHAVVLLDATPPSVVQGILKLIPASAGGIAAAVRGEMTSLTSGKNPERLVYRGAPVGSLGSIPLTVVQHGQPIFSVVKKYGTGIQRIWSSGQKQWTALSSRSRAVTAHTSGHYVYVDQPKLVERLVAAAAAAHS